MNKEFEDDDRDMPEEIDFTGGVRGKYAGRFPKDARAVVLAPDVAALFPDAQSVNDALRLLADVARRQVKAA